VKTSNFETVLYAHDINLHISRKKHKILEKIANHVLKKLISWIRANKLCIDYSKRSFMLINNHNNISFPITQYKKVGLKHLGVIIDDKLN